MGILEIVLLIAGVIIFTGSFFLPLGGEKNTGIDQKAAKEEIHGLVEEEMNNVRSKMQDKMEETSEDAIEKAERALERLTNEKIMAVNEYSDTVLQEIHKNHEEAMFLYDMLNSKHANIKDTVSKMDKAVKAAENKTLENKTAEIKQPQRRPPQIRPPGRWRRRKQRMLPRQKLLYSRRILQRSDLWERRCRRDRTITRRSLKCTNRANPQWQLPKNWDWVSER